MKRTNQEMIPTRLAERQTTTQYRSVTTTSSGVSHVHVVFGIAGGAAPSFKGTEKCRPGSHRPLVFLVLHMNGGCERVRYFIQPKIASLIRLFLLARVRGSHFLQKWLCCYSDKAIGLLLNHKAVMWTGNAH